MCGADQDKLRLSALRSPRLIARMRNESNKPRTHPRRENDFLFHHCRARPGNPWDKAARSSSPHGLIRCTSAWATGSSPVVTREGWPQRRDRILRGPLRGHLRMTVKGAKSLTARAPSTAPEGRAVPLSPRTRVRGSRHRRNQAPVQTLRAFIR